MNAILSVDDNYGIGLNGDLLFHCKEDLQNFKRLTTDKTVIMGRKTLLSLPKQQPLPNRNNIVMSQDSGFSVEGATVCNSVDDLLSTIKDINKEDVFVMGGEHIYRLLLPYTTKIYLTKFEAVREADTFFPNIEESPEWSLKSKSDQQLFGDIKYYYLEYVRA